MEAQQSEDSDDEIQPGQTSSECESSPSHLPVNEPVSVPRCTFIPCEELKCTIAQKQAECDDDPKIRYLEAVDACGHHLLDNCTNCM